MKNSETKDIQSHSRNTVLYEVLDYRILNKTINN